MSDNEKLLTKFLILLVRFAVYAIAIGLFFKHDYILTVLLGLTWLHSTYKKKKSGELNRRQWLFLIGASVFTAIVGTCAEIWGTGQGYWQYNHSSLKMDIPLWLFIAWMLAFYFMYKLESRVMKFFKIHTPLLKTLTVLFLSVTSHVIGESICIYMGAWSYTWPNQVIGIPLNAIGLLIILYLTVYFVLVGVCTKFKIDLELYRWN